MKAVAKDNPLIFSLLLTLAQVLLAVLMLAVSPMLFPGMSPDTQRVVLTALMAVLAALVVTRLGWWRRIGFGGPRSWRAPHLIAVPLAFALWPLLGGWELPAISTLAVLVLGQLVNAFAEETLMRGVVLEALRGKGHLRAIAISAALFGGLHAIRLLFGQDVITTALQVLLSVLLGIGFAAVRLRTDALLPLVLAHALYNLTLGLSTAATTMPVLLVIGATFLMTALLAAWGLLIARAARPATNDNQLRSALAGE